MGEAKRYSAARRNCDYLSGEKGLVADVAHRVLKTLWYEKRLRENLYIPLCIVVMGSSKAALGAKSEFWCEVMLV